jgi:diadenosine tetraphosphate (Ap4A) HIT family hydrolase
MRKNAMDSDCPLCSPDLAPILLESKHWQLVLNHNQNLLGRTFLSLRRHTEQVVELSPDEWKQLRDHLRLATTALRSLFSPDHFNYSFLQNQIRHVHMHIIPRYADVREFSGVNFTDPDYPSHFSVPAPANKLSPDVFEELAVGIRSKLEDTRVA